MAGTPMCWTGLSSKDCSRPQGPQEERCAGLLMEKFHKRWSSSSALALAIPREGCLTALASAACTRPNTLFSSSARFLTGTLTCSTWMSERPGKAMRSSSLG
jgi:hypothetical protein